MIKFKGYNYTNNGYYEKYYEEKAAEGYFIKKIYLSFIHVFEKRSPESLQYKFQYYNTGPIFNKFDKQEESDFLDECKKIEWNYILKDFDFYLFSSLKNNTNELSLEENENNEIIKKRSYTGLYMFIILSFVLLAITFGVNYQPFYKRLDNLGFSYFFCLNYLDETVFYLKNRDNFDKSEKEIKYNKSTLNTIRHIFLIGLLILFIYNRTRI